MTRIETYENCLRTVTLLRHLVRHYCQLDTQATVNGIEAAKKNNR